MVVGQPTGVLEELTSDPFSGRPVILRQVIDIEVAGPSRFSDAIYWSAGAYGDDIAGT
jgi:hypothetical protein